MQAPGKQCRLCGKEAELQISHVFPKFLINWFKETGTGFIRNAKAVNRRAQDGSKERMLCRSCEQAFSVREQYFSSRVFHPVLHGDKTINYDERMMYFLISVLWRVLVVSLPKALEKKNPFLTTILAAEQEWRRFLLGEIRLKNFGHVHLFVFDIGADPPPSTKGFNVYCARAFDGTFVHNDGDFYVYAKFARFLCISILTPYDESKWIKTRVADGLSALRIPQEIRDTFIGGFIVYRANASAEMLDSNLSVRQRQVINQTFWDNADRLENSDLVRAALADYEVANSSKPCFPRTGRNAPCPCGSGLKFKRCHGR